MDSEIRDGLVRLWKCGTLDYRSKLLRSWPEKDVAEILKAMNIRTALELVHSMKAGTDG